MLLTLLTFIVALLIPSMVLLLALMISFRSMEDREKSSPFECGFDPKANARIPFSLRFFLLAVIFLVFDIEIVLLLPIPLLMNFLSSPMMLITTSGFFLILILGLLHEWQEGSLNWTM
uniref:NADH-ubiquinone oxidoreductase chain 3 n=2 Tax=Branchipolynoe TaxID=167792 RepID=A0A343W657_9ANNE|nr:NADH dehydrogenase subunit 3 [Branchipolynoe pettiboneae]AVW86079.1 NADH dehydrogenase subunit 3 [Branchipolynoe sp. YZ-2018]